MIRWTGPRVARRRNQLVGAVLVFGLLAAACGGDDSSQDDPADVVQPVVHVALGDSFSSGEGAPPYDAEPEPCRRSAGAWPDLLTGEGAGATVRLVACAGARTERLVGPWPDRGLEAQIPEEPDTAVTLVTVTIGGNDLDFSDIVASCVLATCAPTPGSDELDARLEDVRRALLEEVHPALQAAFPEARILHVGYPHLVPAEGEPPVDCPWLSGEDVQLARSIVEALDATIEAAAEESADVTFVDVAAAFEGHELCTEEPWVNAVGLEPGDAHPNESGQQALAASVASALEGSEGNS